MVERLSIATLTDRSTLRSVLGRAPGAHAYELGDLDPFYWPHTRWFALVDAQSRPLEIALLYEEHAVPTLIAMTTTAERHVTTLLEGLEPVLPARFECHTARGPTEALQRLFRAARGPAEHLRMVLDDDAALAATDPAPRRAVGILGERDLPDLTELYARAYPTSWFHPRRLETARFVGLRIDGVLRCVAGVHTYAPDEGVASIGDVATHPDARGRGYAAATCARLCELLRADGCSTIALNVGANNTAAIGTYTRIGFAELLRYDETTFERPI